MDLFDNYDPLHASYLAGTEQLLIGKEDENSIGGFVDRVRSEIQAYQDRVNLSITNFIKKLMILSRVFIQNKIIDDPSLNDNLDCIQNQYLSFILAALSLNEDIGNNRTIRKQMEVVSTENYKSFTDIANNVFGSIIGLEAKDNDSDNNGYTKADRNRAHRGHNSRRHTTYGPYGKDASGYGWDYDDIRNYDEKTLKEMAKEDPEFLQELIEKERRRINDEMSNAKNENEKKKYKREQEELDKKYERTKKIEDDKWKKANDLKYASTNAKVNDTTRNLSLASGRIIEVELGVQKKKVNIPVQLIPTVITDQVAEALITLNFRPGWRQRLVQAKAGEISWFKDFLFEMDLVRKYEEALRKDKTGMLYEMKQRQKNAAKDAVLKLATDENKQNIASTIFIFDKQSFLQTAKASGLNWRNQTAREKFFEATFSFMVVLIDPIYAKSEYYWSGIDAVGEYSAKNLKAAAKKESYDLKDIMAAFTQGHSPRF